MQVHFRYHCELIFVVLKIAQWPILSFRLSQWHRGVSESLWELWYCLYSEVHISYWFLSVALKVQSHVNIILGCGAKGRSWKILQTHYAFFIFLEKIRFLKSPEPLQRFLFYRSCLATTAGAWILKPDTPRPKILRQRSLVGLRLCMAWARHLRHATMPLPRRPCQRRVLARIPGIWDFDSHIKTRQYRRSAVAAGRCVED